MTKSKKPGTGTTNKRRKELAAAKLERQSARRAARASAHRRRVRIGWGLAALVGVVVVATVTLWPRDSDESAVAQPSPSPSPSAATLDGCDPAPVPPAEPASWDAAPGSTLAAGTDYTLTLSTNCGDIVIDAKQKRAPQTVSSMLWLADQGYFDSTLCHRLTTAGLFVLQCGDPTATGAGGPGYSVPDENLPGDGAGNYPAGTVAMANAGPGTAGSQFFIVYRDTTLPPNYTIWGTVTSGLDIVERIADAGVADGSADGTPAAAIGIERAEPEPALG